MFDGKEGPMEGTYEFSRVYRHTTRPGLDADMSCYVYSRGMPTVADLWNHLSTVAPHIPLDKIELHNVTARWEDRPTPEEIEARKAWYAESARKHEKWEREMYAKLKAKFEPEHTDALGVSNA